ncbi:MAG: cysteine hydrolase [Spirochaetes bacterium]|nr:cysteine hydrolase [Spirochaetota bacterium]
MNDAVPALIVVDMQNYYLKRESPYCRYFNTLQPGCLNYIITRCEKIVIPNIRRLAEAFRKKSLPVILLRLCGSDPEREDLHHFFRDTYHRGKRAGFDDVYPLESDPWADIIGLIGPLPSDIVINKTTFSPFTGTGIDSILREKGITTLAFTGLSTSQCVETTARDASDRGYGIIHLEDAQADYDEMSHTSSLYSSQGVCGGNITKTGDYIHAGLPPL